MSKVAALARVTLRNVTGDVVHEAFHVPKDDLHVDISLPDPEYAHVVVIDPNLRRLQSPNCLAFIRDVQDGMAVHELREDRGRFSPHCS